MTISLRGLRGESSAKVGREMNVIKDVTYCFHVFYR